MIKRLSKLVANYSTNQIIYIILHYCDLSNDLPPTCSVILSCHSEGQNKAARRDTCYFSLPN